MNPWTENIYLAKGPVAYPGSLIKEVAGGLYYESLSWKSSIIYMIIDRAK